MKARARDAINTSIVSTDTTLVVNIDLISTPTTPIGPVKGIPGNTFTYMTGGASSNIGDPVEYQFDWAGNGSDLSPWQSSTTFTKTWTEGGTFQVKARARDATYPSIMSAWSAGLTVNIAQVTAPTTPTQQPGGTVTFGVTYTYSTGGATSNIGDPVQYFIDFGDGSNSGWLPIGTNSSSKSWFFGGTFNVRAQARDATYPQIVSAWSQPLQVQIDSITNPNAPSGPTPVQVSVSNTYTTGGAVCSLGDPVQYNIDWGDGTNSGWGAASANHAWSAAGTYPVTASARCSLNNQVTAGPSAALSVTVIGPPSSITPTAGSGQSVAAGSPFPVDLQATVYDSQHNPVPNVLVTFTAIPWAGGASGTFPSGNTATTNPSGQASVHFTANATSGSYTVTATTPPVAVPAIFSLTNL